MENLDTILSEFSKDKHWPVGNDKPGYEATYFLKKIKYCLGLIRNPLVMSKVP